MLRRPTRSTLFFSSEASRVYKRQAFAGMQVKGFIAWLMWLFVHLLFLMNMRNRVSVFLHWVWSYFTWQRGARVIQSGVEK